jgi:hypothetical protein
MISIPTIILAFVFAVFLRTIPLFVAPRGAGVDHWFWLSYVNALKRDRVFPPVISKYILDEKQWYPPLFGLLLSRLPNIIIDRWSPHVAIAVDIVRMLLLVAVASWQSEGDLSVILIAALLYATIPIQISYNIQLNPRGLAAIMFDLLLILVLLIIVKQANPVVWFFVILLGALILLTHKMTTQIMVLATFVTAAIYKNPFLLFLVPAWFLAAIVLSRGFYLKVLVAHVEIVKFWNRNWKWVGADVLRESPLYGDGRHERPKKLHKTGLKGLFWYAFILFGFNPAAWIACILVYERIFLSSPILIYPTPLLLWLLIPCLWATLTSVLNPLKCFGAGYLYMYNTSLISSLVIALTYRYSRDPSLSSYLLAVSLILNLAGVALYFVQFLRDKRTRVDKGLDVMLDRLRKLPHGVVMCLPANWCEVVAYKTSHYVLWGGHGLGFTKLEPTWPRLLIPIKEVLSTYNVKYIFTMEGILTQSFLDDLPPSRCESYREYQLFCFDMPPTNSASIGTSL